MIELLELKFSRRWQTNKIESDWSNSPRHSSSRQFRLPSLDSYQGMQSGHAVHFRISSTTNIKNGSYLDGI